MVFASQVWIGTHTENALAAVKKIAAAKTETSVEHKEEKQEGAGEGEKN